MRDCSKCNKSEKDVPFPKAGRICRMCKAKALRDRKFSDPLYYEKRKIYRAQNRDKINEQKKNYYVKNATSVKEKTRLYYDSNRERCKERQRLYQVKAETATVKSWLSKCLKHARAADKRIGRPFDLDIDYLLKLYDEQRGLCAITNIEMKHARNDLYSISIDRINSGGHVKGNVQLVCQAINLAKREYGNPAIIDFLVSAFEAFKSLNVPDFDGFDYPESTIDYSYIKKQLVINKLKTLCQKQFVPPRYDESALNMDFQRIKASKCNEYIINGQWRSHSPSNAGFAGKKLIRHFHPHLWDIKVSDKPTVPEAWIGGKVFDKASWNLVNGRTKISLDRIIRELVFAGAGLVSQIHPGFAKAIYKNFAQSEDRIYDPFAGWGGRMLAACSLGLKYTACEMSPPTYDGLCRMKTSINYNCELHNIDSFTAHFDADFMFTSPPFGTEAYIGSDSIISFDRLIDCTKHIKTRILHVNHGIYNMIKDRCTKVIPVQARVRANSQVANEYLVFL